ncbi:hypothetical protein WMF18_32230 [Sorangium sp. So ce315]|uniref:hypothetical protein n=1 Tax=Sorangium sp. So ce315 TaxID=3133299 RepID=UPI003F62C0BD
MLCVGGPALGVYVPLNLSLYAYTGNNPTNYFDQKGMWLESAWDALSLATGVASLVDNVQQGNWGSAALDTGGVALDAVALLFACRAVEVSRAAEAREVPEGAAGPGRGVCERALPGGGDAYRDRDRARSPHGDRQSMGLRG